MRNKNNYLLITISTLCLSLNLMACNGNNNTLLEPLASDSLMNNKTKSEKMILTDKEWKEKLNAEQYYILREKGTERPYTGKFLLHKEKGNYTCAACGNILFSSDSKFDSHCGWPSFDKEINEGKIVEKTDNSGGMERTEITCGNCGGHLGHVFNDGPTSTGLRYCVNSVSLDFEPMDSKQKPEAFIKNLDTITLGGGCFWCIEAVFQELKGVKSVISGYAGGTKMNIDYSQVSSGTTGHAEVIQIVYDPHIIELSQILKVFFVMHDPTTINRQGADIGTQYRSVIFYNSTAQKNVANEIIEAINKEKVYNNPIITEVSAYNGIVKAEDYHQNYYKNNSSKPYCRAVIQPKMEKFEKIFKNLINN